MPLPTSLSNLLTNRVAGQSIAASDHNDQGTAINAVEANVGLNAQGASATIAARLTAIETALGLKAPLASPALTGTPTAPTAAAGTNTTQLATTAFALGAASGARALNSQTGSYTLADADKAKLVEIDSTTGVNVTVPAGLTAGSFIAVHQRGVGQISLVAGSGLVLDSQPGGALALRGQYAIAWIYIRSSASAVAFGEGLADAATGVIPAAFPSRIRVANNHLVDENNYDLGVLKGFNTNVAATVGGENFVFAQTHYDAMSTLTNAAAVAGPGINRHVLHWNVFEQSAGVFHGISSPTGTATAGSAFDSLDKAIARAGAAGRYTVLEIHTNATGVASTGTVPTWARTGTLPSGSGNELTWLITNGQAFVQTLAQRYANNKFVFGLNINEPTDTSLPNIQSAYSTFVGWYRSLAPMWPIWCSIGAYGNGTPYPTSGTQINTTSLLALDVNNRGIVFEWHDYLDNIGTASTNGYQANGSIDPKEQVTNGSDYHGFTSTANSARSTARTTAYTAHHAWMATLKAVSPKIAIAKGEFGRNNTLSNHDDQVEDTINAGRSAGVCVEIWWQYGTATTSFDSGSTVSPGTGFRAGISSRWVANATARA